MSKCSCTEHELFAGNQPVSVFNLISGKKIKKVIVKELIERNCITKKSKYLCSGCAKYCEEHFIVSDKVDDSSVSPSKSEIKTSFKTLLYAVKNSLLTNEELCELCTAIGESQQQNISKDIEVVRQQYKDDVLLQSYDPKIWLQNRNSVVLSFLKAIMINETTTKSEIRLAETIELIYSLRNQSVVLPLSFCANIATYFLTGSKQVCNTNSKLMPCGSYSTVLSWVNAYGNEPISLDTNGDVISYYDNNQVLARNWRVRVDAKALLSVITQVVHFLPSYKCDLQRQVSLSPRHWLYNTKNREVVEKILLMQSQLSDLFRSFRRDFVQEKLDVLVKAQKISGNTVLDSIDETIQNGPPPKVFKPSFVQKDPYAVVSSNHQHIDVITGNPIPVNPCSFASVKTVLTKLLEETDVPNTRKWTVIGSDGLPYLLAAKLIDQQEAFHDILLQPGLGHYEMNMTKAIIHLLWEVVGRELATILGFRSPKAQQAFHDAHDHHKAWQIIEIMLFGTTDELLLPYVRESMRSHVAVSADSYFQWLSNCMNPNYTFMVEIVFTYLLALYVYRIGVRRNNSEYLLCGRTKFSPLFFGLNKTMYQQIEFRDLKCRVLAPADVKTFIEKHETISVSGNASKGEGYDFVLEAKNRKTKSWIPTGSPTEQQWTRVCRNIDRLEKVRDNMNRFLELTEDDHPMYHCNLESEITAWKTKIRQTNYLSNPFTFSEHQSISGKPLDHELVNFSKKCKDNMNLYFENIRTTDEINMKLEPVFVVKDERKKYHSLEKKTKTELSALIVEEIELLKDFGYEQEGDNFAAKWEKEVKSGTKSRYVEFLKEVKAVFEELADAECVVKDSGVPPASEGESD